MMSVLAIHAHPDDECFAGGGLLATLAANGHHVTSVIGTGGEVSELESAHSIERAREVRLGKYERSLELLGISAWSWLAEPGRWVDHPTGPQLASEHPEVLASAVRECLTRMQPDLVVSFGSDGLTGHPDHVAISRAVRTAMLLDGAPRGGSLGSRVRSTHVDAAHGQLRTIAPTATIGSGRMTGTDAQLISIDVSKSAPRRRNALDSYMPGLGTLPLETLVERSQRIGDSIVMRAVFDEMAWASESFEWLFPPAGRSIASAEPFADCINDF